MWHITYSSRVRKVQQQLSAAERRQTSKTEAFVCISLTRSVFPTLKLSGSRALPCNGKTIILKCCCVIQAYLKAKVLTPVSNGRPQQWRRNCASRSRRKWTVQVEITLAGHKSCVCVVLSHKCNCVKSVKGACVSAYKVTSGTDFPVTSGCTSLLMLFKSCDYTVSPC